jgi:biopolymer transport protein ExbD
MRFGKHDIDESETVPMAPLIDIVFLTLVFFMVTSVYATLESEVDITLPTASSAELDERLQGEIFINLKDTGEIILNNKVVSIPELQDILYKVAEHFPGGSVIIRGDKDAQLGNAIGILDACRNADIPRVSFAALPPEEE